MASLSHWKWLNYCSVKINKSRRLDGLNNLIMQDNTIILTILQLANRVGFLLILKLNIINILFILLILFFDHPLQPSMNLLFYHHIFHLMRYPLIPPSCNKFSNIIPNQMLENILQSGIFHQQIDHALDYHFNVNNFIRIFQIQILPYSRIYRIFNLMSLAGYLTQYHLAIYIINTMLDCFILAAINLSYLRNLQVNSNLQKLSYPFISSSSGHFSYFIKTLNIIMIIHNIIGSILPKHRLLNCARSVFSVQNYMKTFQSKCVTRHHGYFRVDQYQHFDNDPQSLKDFVDSQRKLFEKESAKWKEITQQYYQISSSRRDARAATIPEKYDNYEYYTRVSWHKGRDYSVIYRRPISNPSKQELVLDIMQYPIISRHWKTVELLKTSFSPSHRYVGFGVDLKNNERISFLIADTHSSKKELLNIKEEDENIDRIEDVNDMLFTKQKEVFYLKTENHRPSKLIYRDLVSGKTENIYEEMDSQFYLNIRLSKDKKYLILTGNSKQRSKIWIVNLTNNQIKLIKVWEESNKVYLNHVDDHFIVWLRGDSSVIKLIGDKEFIQASKKQGNKQLNFKNLPGTIIYTCQQEQIIEEIDIIQNNIVLYMQRINCPLLKIINYVKKLPKESVKDNLYKIQITNASIPYDFGVIAPGTNQNFMTDQIVFFMSTPFVYEEVYSYSISNRSCKVVQKYQHTGPKFPANKYEITHVDVPSTTMDYIPLTIIGPKKRSTGKMIIHFYGFYGIPTRVGYDNVSIAALEKGWTIAYAHVRGGGQKGKKWHQQALGMNRDRTWKDLEECVGYLIKQRYTHPSLLFISSHSAGAIALWNAISHKPNLYKGAIFKFPFLDVLTSLLDKSQPLSNTDYEQFGNPIENKNSYQQIEAISPYQNIQCIQYPVIHIVAGENDYRTPVSQVAKFISRFRDRALENGRVKQLGIKGTTVDISSSASHLGEASIKDENYKGCDVFGYMDYVLNKVSKDCTFID